MFTRDELSEDAIRAHAEKTSMLLLNLVHKISDLEFEKEEAGRAMQALVDAGLEMHKQGWEKCREEAVAVAMDCRPNRPLMSRAKADQITEAIRALEYSNE